MVGLKLWNRPRHRFLTLCLPSRTFTLHSYPNRSIRHLNLYRHDWQDILPQPCPGASSLVVVCSHAQVPFASRLDLPAWQEDRTWSQHQDTRDLDGATPRQQLSRTYSLHQELAGRTFHKHLPTQWWCTLSWLRWQTTWPCSWVWPRQLQQQVRRGPLWLPRLLQRQDSWCHELLLLQFQLRDSPPRLEVHTVRVW